MHIQSIPMWEGSSNNYAYLVVDEESRDAVIIDPASAEEWVFLFDFGGFGGRKVGWGEERGGWDWQTGRRGDWREGENEENDIGRRRSWGRYITERLTVMK